ncbi:MAG: hypothetical protein ACO260_04075, partial [Hylemonella sp.]
RVGGLQSVREIHDMCVDRGAPMWCGGMLESGIGRAHNIHLATMPGFVYPGDTASASRTYARDIVGEFVWDSSHFDGASTPAQEADPQDNARIALKARVCAPLSRQDSGPALSIPLAQTVLYECHVKGFSQRNPALPAALRGSFAGLAHPASIAHLQSLGVTAVSLLPVH